MFAHWLGNLVTEAASEIARLVEATARHSIHRATIEAISFVQRANVAIHPLEKAWACALTCIWIDETNLATIALSQCAYITLGTCPTIFAWARAVLGNRLSNS